MYEDIYDAKTAVEHLVRLQCGQPLPHCPLLQHSKAKQEGEPPTLLPQCSCKCMCVAAKQASAQQEVCFCCNLSRCADRSICSSTQALQGYCFAHSGSHQLVCIVCPVLPCAIVSTSAQVCCRAERKCHACRRKSTYAPVWTTGAPVSLHYITLQTCMQVSTRDKEEELRKMQEKYGVDGEQHAREQAEGKRG